MSYIPRYKTKYKDEVVPKLMEEFKYTSIMEVPRLEKICINQGLGDAVADKKVIDNALVDLTTIAGQKAVITKATKFLTLILEKECRSVSVLP